jgi:uncharacterized protein YcbX
VVFAGRRPTRSRDKRGEDKEDETMGKELRPVGTLVAIEQYPVKSMAGGSVQAGRVTWHGLAGDRRHAFLRTGNSGGLPFLSAREVPPLIRYTARYDAPEDPERSPITVTTPTGRYFAFGDPELTAEIAELHGGTLAPFQLYRGTFDSMDLSIITVQSIRSFGASAGLDLEPARFRPNLVIDAGEGRSYPEDRWVGELLVFGDRPDSARIRVDRKDMRCMVVNLDPQTAQQEPAILRELVRSRKNLLGVYGTTAWPGTLRVGDVVHLVKG